MRYVAICRPEQNYESMPQRLLAKDLGLLRFATLATRYDRLAIYWVLLERHLNLLKAIAWK